MSEPVSDLKTTPLTGAHIEAGARMVEFAGYSMPVQYRDGVLKEHLWTRENAGLFDVSHMGPAILRLKGGGDTAALAGLVEPLICGDLSVLAEGRQNLVPGQALEYGKSITDACLGWEDSVAALETLAQGVVLFGQYLVAAAQRLFGARIDAQVRRRRVVVPRTGAGRRLCPIVVAFDAAISWNSGMW